MTRDVAGRILPIVRRQLGVDEGRVTVNASFVEDLGADSLSLTELTLALEEEFEIDIPDEEAEKIVTFQDVLNYIKAHSGQTS